LAALEPLAARALTTSSRWEYPGSIRPLNATEAAKEVGPTADQNAGRECTGLRSAGGAGEDVLDLVEP
jgi:hypothetical protein